MKGNTGADVDRAIIQSLNSIADSNGGGAPAVNQDTDDEEGRSFDMRAYRRGLVFGGKEEPPENPFRKLAGGQGGAARKPKGGGGVDDRNDEEYQRLLAPKLSNFPICLKRLQRWWGVPNPGITVCRLLASPAMRGVFVPAGEDAKSYLSKVRKP
jgi:hypothetical protein